MHVTEIDVQQTENITLLCNFHVKRREFNCRTTVVLYLHHDKAMPLSGIP